MKQITKRQAEKAYLRDSTTCPFCGGEIVADEMTGDGDFQNQETHCSTCGAMFAEVYKIVVVDLIKPPKLIMPGVKTLKENKK